MDKPANETIPKKLIIRFEQIIGESSNNQIVIESREFFKEIE